MACPPIPDPFPDVAVHIKEPPWVGLEASNRSGPIGDQVAATAVAPAELRTKVGKLRIAAERGLVVAETVAGLGAGARGIFPFGFGRQPIRLAGQALQPRHI